MEVIQSDGGWFIQIWPSFWSVKIGKMDEKTVMTNTRTDKEKLDKASNLSSGFAKLKQSVQQSLFSKAVPKNSKCLY